MIDKNKMMEELSNIDPIILLDILSDGKLKHIIKQSTDYESLNDYSKEYILDKFRLEHYFDYWKDIGLTLNSKLIQIEFCDLIDREYDGFRKHKYFVTDKNKSIITKFVYTKKILIEQASILIREFKFKELENDR